ncbi:hypothetical protein [Salsipaludibacter albus]|uniref:hypothetical protein n=1 Tax=Salsipaludibacter albus TaxID=2849650 RepID=UPI001EE4E9AA|nr:hypothetical protein [Salsipaludibacter albus]MBY5162755.1 hypothetical protein [Salsipaludibacter albus]
MGRGRVLVAVVVLATVSAGCSDEGPSSTGTTSPTATSTSRDPTTSAAPATESVAEASVVAARRADLATVTELFETRHVAPLDLGPELPDDAELAAMDEPAFLATVMDATAGRARDGHSGVFPLAQPDMQLWPLQLYPFADGWRVVAALPGHDDLVGREVTAIGGREPDATADLVAPLVPRDNDASLRGRLPQYLVVPEVLAGVGLAPTLELDGQDVALDPVPARDYATHFDLFDPLVCPGLPSEVPTWDVRTVDDAVVVRWGRVVFRLDGRSHREFVDEVATTIESADPARVVLDLRDNPGGELPANAPLVDLLQDVTADDPDALRILVGRCTFSAAALMAAELRTTTDARLLGETMGGAPGLWADARLHRLPESGIQVHVATGAYGDMDRPAATVVDREVPVRWDDHAAGRDPTLAAALQP